MRYRNRWYWITAFTIITIFISLSLWPIIPERRGPDRPRVEEEAEEVVVKEEKCQNAKFLAARLAIRAKEKVRLTKHQLKVLSPHSDIKRKQHA